MKEPRKLQRLKVGRGQGTFRVWHARLVIDTTNGHDNLDINLHRQPHTRPDEVSFTGRTLQMGVTVTLRREGDRVQGTVDYTYTHDVSHGWQAELAAIETLVAAHGKGVIKIEDRDGNLPTLETPTAGRELPENIAGLRALAHAVVTIEATVGEELGLPDEIDEELFDSLLEAAYVIENGESGIEFGETVFDLPPERFESLADRSPIATAINWSLQIPGREPVFLGYLSHELTDWTVISADPIQLNGELRVRTKIGPKDDAGRKQRFKYTRENPMAGSS